MPINKIPSAIIRGGTSKGIFLNANDLPSEPKIRYQKILSIFGSPDKRQIDGLGGADPLTSKLAIIAPSAREGIDIEYTFGQAAIDSPSINYSLNCGNILSGAAIYAVECFVDDIAHELSLDPVQLRISLLDREPRLRHVLTVAEKKALSTKENNHALGCAILKGYGSYIAVITEMALIKDSPSIIRMTAVWIAEWLLILTRPRPR